MSLSPVCSPWIQKNRKQKQKKRMKNSSNYCRQRQQFIKSCAGRLQNAFAAVGLGNKTSNRINMNIGNIYRVARKFCGSFILRIADFLWFAGTNFCGSRWLKFLLGTNFCDALVQAAEYLVEQTWIFSTFIETVNWVTVHSSYEWETYHCYTLLRKRNEQLNKKPTPTMHSQTLFR